ncbi:MAG: ABC transporter permease [Anaerolineae bacterium]|jgi:ABC-2 type transport system permease protein
MRKVLLIARKDLLVAFRDTGAVIYMLLTPFALTLAIAFAFGGLGGSGSSGGIAEIPLVIVNQDTGPIGEAVVETLTAPDLQDLLEPVVMDDVAAAREAVDRDAAAAAVVLPSGLSAAVIPTGPVEARASVEVEVYVSPSRPVGASVVRSVVEQVVGRVCAASAAAEVSLTQLVESGSLAPADLMAKAPEIAERTAHSAGEAKLVSVDKRTGDQVEAAGFDWLAYSAPSMAVMFLMFTAAAGGRTLLVEREGGTLARLLITPSRTAEVLAGKVGGTFVVGLAQMTVLLVASRVLFGLDYGNPGAVALLTVALVLAATAWGTLIAAYSRSPGQANAVGTAVSLVFGAVAGNFVPRFLLPQWLQYAGFISPNAWGLEAFTRLLAGEGWGAVLVPVAALLAMAVVLFLAAVAAFRRQYAEGE